MGTARAVGRAALVLAVAIGLDVALASLVGNGATRQLLLLCGCNVVLAVSFNLSLGLLGQLSFGQAGFLALGAYTAAIVASHLSPSSMSLAAEDAGVTLSRSFLVVPPALFAAVAVATLAGVLVALPSLRLRGDTLAVVTLGFAEALRLSIASAPAGDDRGLGRLGGVTGYMGADGDGVPLVVGPFWVVISAAVVLVASLRLKASPWGRAVRAVREDERAASTLGVPVARRKVEAFALAAAGAGLAGGLMALLRDGTPIVQPESFGLAASFDAVAMVVVGGAGSVTGAAVGAVILTVALRALELSQGTWLLQSLEAAAPRLDLPALRAALYALALVALVVTRPEGLLGDRELGASSERPGSRFA